MWLKAGCLVLGEGAVYLLERAPFPRFMYISLIPLYWVVSIVLCPALLSWSSLLSPVNDVASINRPTIKQDRLIPD